MHSNFCLALSLTLPLVLLPACLEDKGEGDSGGAGDGAATTPAETATWGNDSPCPADVPEEYQYLWDCHANQCDEGDRVLYHWGSGSSQANMDLDIDEKWFMFWTEDDVAQYCVDTFHIEGEESKYDVGTFECDGCELIFDVSWTLDSDNDCSTVWGSLFIDDKDEDDGPFNGVLLMDTHNAFGGRNEDNAMLVYSAPFNDNYYYKDLNYGRGTAWPSTEVDGPPEDYNWVSSAQCLNY